MKDNAKCTKCDGGWMGLQYITISTCPWVGGVDARI